MPHLQPADIIFTCLMGVFTLALTILALREDYLRRKSH